MSGITLESITKKLGFDPMNPPEIKVDDDWIVDDHTPSIWAPLTQEEKTFVYEKKYGVKL